MFSKRFVALAGVAAGRLYLDGVGRDLKLRAVSLLGAVFALTLFAAPASAVTFVDIVPGNTNNAGVAYDLAPSTVFTFNSLTGSAGSVIDHIFEFNYSPPPDLGAVSSVAINDIASYYPMALTWWFNSVDVFGTAGIVQGPLASASPGADINTALSLATGAGYYWLELTGTAGGLGGQYNLSVVSNTPLPAAVWLFGSVLAGGAGFMRLHRRKAKTA